MQLISAAVNNSPYYRHINMTLVDYDAGKSVLEMPVSHQHLNIYGAAHGGVIASIADSACGLSLASLLEAGESAVTLDIRVNYTAAVKEGLLTATGEVSHRGKTTAVAIARLTQNGNLVAVAMATHFIKQKPF